MPPSSMPYPTWCKSLWCELSEGAYGSEWRRTLRGGRGPFSLPQSGRPRGVQLGTASGPTTLVRLGTSAAVEDRPAAVSPQGPFRGLLPRGSDALGGGSASLPDVRTLAVARRPSPDDELPGSDPGIVIATRAGVMLHADTEPGRLTPDAQSDTGGMISHRLLWFVGGE